MLKALSIIAALLALACAVGVVKEPIQADKLAAGFFCAILAVASVAAWKAKGFR